MNRVLPPESEKGLKTENEYAIEPSLTDFWEKKAPENLQPDGSSNRGWRWETVRSSEGTGAAAPRCRKPTHAAGLPPCCGFQPMQAVLPKADLESL